MNLGTANPWKLIGCSTAVKVVFAIATLASAFGIGSASAAVVAGRTPTTFTVTNSGAANYTIPIWTPPGVGAVQLQLALSYSSRSPDGVMGMGWSLSGLSAISRCNKTWEQDGAPSGVTLTTSDRYCLDGQQLKVVSSGVYATEIESFSGITSTGVVGGGPASFTVTTKNGLIYDYGLTSDSQIMAGSSGTIRTWALSQIRDRVGNKINFSYTNDTTNGSYRIASIFFPATATGQGPFYEVLFTYVARPATDVPSAYVAGYPTREVNQLNTITVETYPGASVIKTYSLSYTQSATTNRLRLASVQECSASNCFPATQIAYQNGSQGWTTTVLSLGHTTVAPSRVFPADLNGDGIMDVVYPIASGANYAWQVMFGNPDGSFAAPQSLGITTAAADPVIPADMAGRGITDLLYPYAGYFYRLYWNGSIFVSANTNVTLTNSIGTIANPLFADVNGDGLPDLLWAYNDTSGPGNATALYMQLNTTLAGGAVAFGAAVKVYSPPFNVNTEWLIQSSGTPGISSIRTADFNGDGRADLILPLQKIVFCPLLAPTGSADSVQPLCTTQHYFIYSQLFSTGSGFTSLSGSTQTAVLVDWNGDGCTDLAEPGYLGAGNWKVYLSACGGSGLPSATGIDTGIPSAQSVLAVDWDGDGRQDLLGAGSTGTWKVARSTGEGVAASLIDTGITPGSNAWFAGDFDGDAEADLGYVDAGASNTLKVFRHAGPGTPPDLGTTFTDGFGMYQSPVYFPLTAVAANYHKCDGTVCPTATFPESDYAGPLYVVGQMTASDGTGSMYQHVHSYYGATLHAQGRGFEGFYKKRLLDYRNNLVAYDFLARKFPYTGMLVEHDVYQKGSGVQPPDGSVVSTWLGTPGNQTLGSGHETRTFPFLSVTTDKRYEYPSAAFITQTGTNYTYSDGYGNQNVIATTVTDEDSGSPYYGLAWTTTVNNTFSNTATCSGLPTVTTVQNAAPLQTTQTRTYNYTVDSTYCRVTHQDIEPSTASLHVNTTLGFDSCGNVNSVSVTGHNPDGSAMTPPTRTTLFNYGTRCQLPETVTNALLQPTTIAYNYNFGVPSSATDPNNLPTSWAQDDFGRLSRETRPDGTYTNRGYGSCLNSACGVADLALYAQDVTYGSDSSYVTNRNVYFDGFDRMRFDEAYRVLGTWTYDAIVYYDSLGRRTTQYQPYSSSSNGYRTWSYDSLNRVNSVKLYQPSGTLDRTTTIGYAGRTTTVTDPLGRQTQNVADVMGRLRRVVDPSPGGTTYYDFDAFGNLNRIQDPIGTVSSGTYNLRGFRTQWADADRGAWNFSGDSLNELVSWTDANGHSFSAIYDAIGRMTSRTEPEGTSNWIWGTSAASHNIGRLYSVSGYGYSDVPSYDSFGRLQTRVITTDQAYQYDYTYNTIGALNTVAYPTSPIPNGQTGSRFTVQYGYSYGEPYTISDVTSGTGVTLWSLTGANDYDLPTAETLYSSPNASTVASGYKLWTGELTSIQSGVSPSATNRQNLAYQWDTVGNLTQRVDNIQVLTESFTPDALNRLQSSTLNGGTNLTVGYDASGNITSKSDVGTYTYPTPASAHPHGATAAGSFSFTYDNNGNVSTRNGLSQTWASFNLPTALQATVSGSTYVSQFWYGPEHQRWKQYATYSNGNETTFYAGGLLEKVTPSTTGVTYWRHYVNTPSGLTILVSRNSNGSYSKEFALSDHLGSSDAVLNSDGSLAVQESFTPFGARRGSNWGGVPSSGDWTAISGITRRGFTFHEHLDNIGLIHANGRTYDPVVGRFMSVDPLIGDLGDSQSVNPYAYVGNRPLSAVDPTGLQVGFIVNFASSANTTAADQGGLNVYVDVVAVVADVISFLSSTRSHPPPPPPPTVLGGVSAQTGTPCSTGTFVGPCGSTGNLLSGNAAGSGGSDAPSHTPRGGAPGGSVNLPTGSSTAADWKGVVDYFRILVIHNAEPHRELGAYVVRIQLNGKVVYHLAGISNSTDECTVTECKGPNLKAEVRVDEVTLEGRRPATGTVVGTIHYHPGGDPPSEYGRAPGCVADNKCDQAFDAIARSINAAYEYSVVVTDQETFFLTQEGAFRCTVDGLCNEYPPPSGYVLAPAPPSRAPQ